MTTSQQLATLSPADALEQADLHAVDHDEDWDEGATTFTFEDGSQLRISGTDVEVL